MAIPELMRIFVDIEKLDWDTVGERVRFGRFELFYYQCESTAAGINKEVLAGTTKDVKPTEQDEGNRCPCAMGEEEQSGRLRRETQVVYSCNICGVKSLRQGMGGYIG